MEYLIYVMQVFSLKLPPLTSVLSSTSSCLWRVHHQAEWLPHHPRLAQRIPSQQELRVAAGGAHPVPHHSGVRRVRDRRKRCELAKEMFYLSVGNTASSFAVVFVVSKIVQCLPSGV